jgi:hypothetical protein
MRGCCVEMHQLVKVLGSFKLCPVIDGDSGVGA